MKDHLIQMGTLTGLKFFVPLKKKDRVLFLAPPTAFFRPPEAKVVPQGVYHV